jgi:tellurite resistance protein
MAEAAMVLGLALHAALAAVILRWVMTAPVEARQVTPLWHLHFVGFIIAGLTAPALGYATLATGLLVGTGVLAAIFWTISAVQLAKQVPPAPLRPLLAVHLAPASLLGIVAALQGWQNVAQGFAVLGGLILLALVVNMRWLTKAGFTALWGAFTFPLAAYASLLLLLGGFWLYPATVLLIAALGIVPAIALKVIQAWTRGTLAEKTNAATA